MHYMRIVNLLLIKLSLIIGIYTVGERCLYAEEVQETISPIYFIGLADIHFDPFVNCNVSSGKCPLIARLKSAPVSEWQHLLASAHITESKMGQDTNYALLRKALMEASEQANKNNAQFVVVLGDMLGHEYRNDYRVYSGDRSYAGYVQFANKTMAFITKELAAAFPDKSVYMTVGNNDSYSGDYVTRPNEQFFRDIGNMWVKLIKQPAGKASLLKTFNTAGYYAIQLTPDLRLLVLNTVMFSHKAVGRGSNQAAIAELKWLHQQLIDAKANHERVVIAMHVPMNIEVYAMSRIYLFKALSLWKPAFTKAFEADMQEFASEIAGLLSGHTHFGWFHINQEQVPMSGVPAISPIFGQTPKFKLYEVLPNGSMSEAATYSIN